MPYFTNRGIVALTTPEVIDPANLLTSPEDLTGWNAINCTVSTDGTTNPNGVLNADKFIASVGFGAAVGLYQDFTYGNATYRMVGRFKKDNWDFVCLDFHNNGNAGAVFNINTGAVTFSDTGVTAGIVTLNNGWYRCTIEKALSAGASFPEFYQVGSGTSNDRTRSTGSPASGDAAWAWGITLVTA